MTEKNFMYVYDDRIETTVKKLEDDLDVDSTMIYEEAEFVLEEFEESTMIKLFRNLVDLELDSKMTLADIRHELVRVTVNRITESLDGSNTAEMDSISGESSE